MPRPPAILLRLAAAFLVLLLGASACSTLDPETLGAVPQESSETSDPQPVQPRPDAGESETAPLATSTSTIAPTDGTDATVSSSPFGADGLTDLLVPEIVSTVRHDPTAFTQGLELFRGAFVESTGLYGASSRQRIDAESGELLASESLPADLFAGGLTVYQNILIQLTWREGIAVLADPETLAELDRFSYEGEGWGLCAFDEELAMSDGSGEIVFRDPMSFLPLRSITVTLDGTTVSKLNELECVDGRLWANVWLTNDILVIDILTGEVVASVDATSLAPNTTDPENVLNGIAHNAASDTFFLTGKRWDTIYEVKFVPAG